MTHAVSASIPLELTLNITGTISRLTAAMSDTNAPEVFVEDVAIEHLLYDVYDYTPPSPGTTVGTSRRIRTEDLLANVDTTNSHVQTLLWNILQCVSAEATEALIAEAGE